MSIAFSAGELVNIAIGIEKQGIAYYDVMAKSSWHEVAGDVFRHLADMERQHLATFQNMLNEIVKDKPLPDLSGVYEDYLKALVENAVFTDELAASELATHLDNEVEAMDIAISAEKDSVLFYYNMSEVMPPAAQPVVRKILAEEKVHLSQLSELKQKLINL